MLLDLHATAVLCGITWAKAIEMAVEGELPRPLIVSGLARWRRSDLQEWVAAGCPAIAPMAFDVDDLDGEEFRFVHAVHREFCKQPGCESEEA
jgi:predicted DNA-binding transcriptional regulator AlpA